MMVNTYCERAQLSRTALPPNRVNLGKFARIRQHTRTRLKIRERLIIQQVRIDQQRIHARSHRSNERRRGGGLAIKAQHQHPNHDILDRNERGLAKSAEGKPLAETVRERDEQAGRFQRVRRK